MNIGKNNHDKSKLIITYLQTIPQYSVTIIAEDHGIPSLRNTSNITINLIDSNEFCPEFTNQEYQFAVVYNVKIGNYR